MSVTELTSAPFWSVGRCEITLLERDWLKWSRLKIHFCLTLLKQIQRHGIPAVESTLQELQGVHPHQGGKHRRDKLQSTTGRSVHKSTGNYWFLTLWNQMQNNSFFQSISFLLEIDILVQIAVVAAQHPSWTRSANLPLDIMREHRGLYAMFLVPELQRGPSAGSFLVMTMMATPLTGNGHHEWFSKEQVLH